MKGCWKWGLILVVILAITCSCLGLAIYAYMSAAGSSIDDWAIFGYEQGIGQEAQRFMPGAPRPKEFDTLKEATQYFEKNYSLTQEVGYKCELPKEATEGVKVSELDLKTCSRGFILVLKSDTPSGQSASINVP